MEPSTLIEHGLASISFPSISTGAYRFPVDEAAKVAIETVLTHKDSLKVRFVLFDSATHAAYQRALTSALSQR